jgi:hypothetical protein
MAYGRLGKAYSMFTRMQIPYEMLKCPKCGEEADSLYHTTEDENGRCLQCALEQWGHLVTQHRKLARACAAIGHWMSAAMDDPKVCAEMKADIDTFFSNFDPRLYDEHGNTEVNFDGPTPDMPWL